MADFHERVINHMPFGVTVFRWEDESDNGAFRIVWRNSAAAAKLQAPDDTVGTSLRESYPNIMETELPAALAKAIQSGGIQDLPRLTYADDRVPAGVFHSRVVPLGDREVAVYFDRLDESPPPRQAARGQSVLVLESDWVLQRAIQQSLSTAGYHVSRVSGGLHEALASIADVPPDLLLIDVVLRDGLDGIEVARQLTEHSNAPVLFVSTSSDAATVTRAATIRPAGFVLKPFQEEQLLTAVAIALAHGPVDGARTETGNDSGARGVSRSAVDGPSDAGRDRFGRVAAALVTAGRGATELTDRELEVVQLLMSNGRVRSIATRLDISQHTVRNHLRSIFRKLGVHSQEELIREVARHPRA